MSLSAAEVELFCPAKPRSLSHDTVEGSLNSCGASVFLAQRFSRKTALVKTRAAAVLPNGVGGAAAGVGGAAAGVGGRGLQGGCWCGRGGCWCGRPWPSGRRPRSRRALAWDLAAALRSCASTPPLLASDARGRPAQLRKPPRASSRRPKQSQPSWFSPGLKEHAAGVGGWREKGFAAGCSCAGRPHRAACAHTRGGSAALVLARSRARGLHEQPARELHFRRQRQPARPPRPDLQLSREGLRHTARKEECLAQSWPWAKPSRLALKNTALRCGYACAWGPRPALRLRLRSAWACLPVGAETETWMGAASETRLRS